MHEYTAYVPGILLLYCTCDVQYLVHMYLFSKLVTVELLSLGMTHRHGHWVCWMSMCGKSYFRYTHTTAISSVEHVLEVTA